MNSRAIIVLLALALSLGLAACGGSGDSGDDKLSKSELAAKADAICKAGEDAASAVKTPKSFDDPVAAFAYFDKIVPLHQKQTDDLVALVPDDDAKADWDAFIATQNRNNELLITIRDKAKAKDPSGAQDLQKFTASSAEFAKAATKVGSAQCAGTA